MQPVVDQSCRGVVHGNIIVQVLLLVLLAACASPATPESAAEDFIDAFYDWQPGPLKTLLARVPTTQLDKVLYYQAWAQAANYSIFERRPCALEDDEVRCAITVSDDFGTALGYRATDTFVLTSAAGVITAVDFSGDDPPVFMQLFDWIAQNQPKVLTGPCLDMFAGGDTPADCARAVVAAARVFVSSR
ncbi:MAG: hypothetical protein ACR2PZ_09185 [Pseudomonadales bacterium]